jgi:hypothetical protein
MLDSERRYPSTVSDSRTERTLQLTRSSISFQVSAATAFNPLGAQEAGKASSSGANHTSRSFSGPVLTLVYAD